MHKAWINPARETPTPSLEPHLGGSILDADWSQYSTPIDSRLYGQPARNLQLRTV